MFGKTFATGPPNSSELDHIMISCHKLGTTTYHNVSKVMISYNKRVAVFPICFFFLFLFFVSFFLCVLLFFFVFSFLYLLFPQFTVNKWDEVLFPSRPPEEAASMSAVRQLHGRPTPRSMSGASPNSLIRCNTWCESSSVPQCASPCARSHCRARAQRPGRSRYF